MDAYIVYCKINGDRITVGGAVFTAGNDCPLTARLSIAVLAIALACRATSAAAAAVCWKPSLPCPAQSPPGCSTASACQKWRPG